MELKKKAEKIIDILEREYPNPKLALNFKTPFQLLIAAILSAQCTDERVNKVTPLLFKRYNTPKKLANVELKELEDVIKPTGFYKNKAKGIKECSQKIAHDFDGKVPDTLEELITLSCVGRKTANIVLGNAFNKQAVAVDTHVKRVSKRVGLAESDSPDRIEHELCSILPQSKWTEASNLFILHGRNICRALRPLCERCKIRDYCNLFTQGYRFTMLVSVVCSVLIINAFFYKPVVSEMWKVIFNRVISVSAVWITALLGMQREFARQKQEEALSSAVCSKFCEFLGRKEEKPLYFQ